MKDYIRRSIPCLAAFIILCLVSSAMAAVDTSQVADKIRTAAVPFIGNQGQVAADVAFYAPGLHGTFFVTHGGELVYNLPHIEETRAETGNKSRDVQYAGGLVLREHLVNARVNKVTADREAVARVSCFRGNDPGTWQSRVPTYAEVSLGKVYEGIELRLKAYGDAVEKVFYVSPGADPALINLAIRGADGLQVLATGELQASSQLGNVHFTRPVAWQEKDGRRVPVPVAYTVVADGDEHVYAFQVGPYDRSAALVIDPLLASTYLGGTGGDWGNSITLDRAGNVYVTGSSNSTDYPTTAGAYSRTKIVNCNVAFGCAPDIVISKLSSDLSTLLASTYLGGTDVDGAVSLALDSAGNVYVTGSSTSEDYPTTAGAYRRTGGDSCGDLFGCAHDIVISKLSSDLGALLASTYLGGTGNDNGTSMALDSAGVYVTGTSSSTDYPTTAGAYDQTLGGVYDIIISKLSPDLSTLLASTYLGGSANDGGSSMALDSGGNVYVTGGSYSTDYPTTDGAYDQTMNGFGDMVISKLSPDLSTVLASTYLGGTDFEYNPSIALDGANNVYVTRTTYSDDFPTTAGAYDRTSNNLIYLDYKYYDIFVAKLSSGLGTLLASTYLGGTGDDWGNAIALDGAGNVYVTGGSDCSNYPTTAGAYDQTMNGTSDLIISRLSSNLGTLKASTFLGGASYDGGAAIALDRTGHVYVTGSSSSTDYPTQGGGSTFAGDSDVVISKLTADLAKNQAPPPYILLLKK